MTSDDLTLIVDAVQLDRNSPVPLYFQAAQALEQAITSGKLPPGTRLHNELLLAESNGSSVDVPWRALDLYERVTGLTQPDEDRHTALGDARFVRQLWEWAHQ